MTALMRAKLSVRDIVQHDSTSQTVHFAAVGKNTGYDAAGSDEDNTYAAFTPSANLQMLIANPALQGKFAIGDTFYVDFTPVVAADESHIESNATDGLDADQDQELHPNPVDTGE